MLTLIGMPAVGKSTIGKRIAAKFGYEFIDVDKVIRAKYGKKLIEIIKEIGEDGFIELEGKVLLEIPAGPKTILSPGGSIIYNSKAMKKLERGLIIYLKISLDLLKKRLTDVESRGIIGIEKGMGRLYEERGEYYEKYADTIIDTDNKSEKEIEDAVVNVLEAKKIFLKTFGCTLNQSDSDLIRALLSDCAFMNRENHADLLIVNTCTVKTPTEAKILHYISKYYNNKKIIIAGCIPSHNPEMIKRRFPKAGIVGPQSINRISEAVNRILNGKKAIYLDKGSKEGERIFSYPIARIPLVEGCTGACTFCATRIARNPLYSYPIDYVVCFLEKGINEGIREFQLTGQEVSCFGLERGGFELPGLMKRIISIHESAKKKCKSKKAGCIFRVRMGMMNVKHLKEFGEEYFKLLKGEPFYKFLHLPVQSGSNNVLMHMKRGYSVEDFEEIIRLARKTIPDIVISTDIIVGYPTETERDFSKTLALIRRIKPDIINVSKFGRRPKTEGWEMKEIPPTVMKSRVKRLNKLFFSMAENKNKKYIGKKVEVLVTEKGKGRLDNYKQAAFTTEGNNPLPELGSAVKARITKVTRTSLIAEF